MITIGLALTAVVAAQSPSPLDLARFADNAAKAALAKYSDRGVKPDQIGITLAVLDRKGNSFQSGSYRGAEAMYPASVVKMFFLAYAGHLLEKKKLRMTPELERAVHDMIVDSVNDATGLVLETVTGTTGGPELSPKELARWMDKRQAVNRWFASLGYPTLNACQKTWNEGPYGRERQGYGPHFELRNSLSPNVCVRLMSDIALDKIVSPGQCAWMRGYLSRAIPADSKETNEQSKLFSGKVLPSGTKLWSKAGWTDTVRHDVAYIQLPDGREFVYAIFTKDHSNEAGLIPFIASAMLKELGVKPVE
ncbi:serine hydrolase [Fimbriimonas ginsengisoli]|uniref:Beta-lactamase class A catalytic domain-containing protein n=1 Tax=Fimbriimonas ginsengisoli Gsoil 348 TaxID=661478 RepID=A0A068NUP9_FIMGI|nr:serine hydrolase [Fimbriimonas ginsengisoli]AIE87268.1 hypothetical protein OP10G_3900 [Fimbriimonas ginsengisoli Gsoil 348]